LDAPEEGRWAPEAQEIFFDINIWDEELLKALGIKIK